MAFFKLKPNEDVKFPAYPFDFHSHFAGILPVESPLTWRQGDFVFHAKGTHEDIVLTGEQELSLIGLLAGEAARHNPALDRQAARREAHYRLFDLGLERMTGEKNPFRAYDKGNYLRGECAAESLYLACVILLRRFGLCLAELDIDRPDVYQATRELLRDPTKRDEETDQLVRYFNRKVWSANKYTPFDDAYWIRGTIRDRYGARFAAMTLGYLYEEGIDHTQTATGADEIAFLNDLFVQFNEARKTHYTLLAHTAHAYGTLAQFDKELAVLTKLFAAGGDNRLPYPTLVGLDLLGMETATGLYEAFFQKLVQERDAFEAYAKQPGRKKVVVHIHCGEGTGVSANNRSLCGYFLRNSALLDPSAFYPALAAYAHTCYRNTLDERKGKDRERQHAPHRKQESNALGELFDELFHDNSLTVDGLRVQRFDITSPTTQSLIGYHARNNIMHLANALEQPQGQAIIALDSPFALRIGHGYHYRNYVASKFPTVTFDTNLGSNFITGAAVLFDSANAYRLNRGLRHLNGYVDTDTLKATTTAISYLENPRLTLSQMAYLHDMSRRDRPSEEDQVAFDRHIEPVPDYIRPILKKFFFAMIERLRLEGTGRVRSYLRYRVYLTLFAIALNWRSYLLGADGQGVEHSNVQDEAVRMALLLAYGIYKEHEEIDPAVLIGLHVLFLDLANAYWKATLDEPGSDREVMRFTTLTRFEGFVSPDSVVLIHTER